MVQNANLCIWMLSLSTHRQREVQDLEGDLGLVLGVDGEFADGFAEMSAE